MVTRFVAGYLMGRLGLHFTIGVKPCIRLRLCVVADILRCSIAMLYIYIYIYITLLGGNFYKLCMVL